MKSIPRFFAPPGPAFASRRDFLARAGSGFGTLALAGLLEEQGLLGRASARMTAPRNPLAPRPGHVDAKARSVIWLFMNGGPSQVDTWDYKPELAKRDGQELQGLRQEHRLLHRPGRPGDEVAVPLHAARPVRQMGFGDLSEHRPARRQDGLHPFVLVHVEQPLARPVQDQHGHVADGLPLHGLVGDLRPGEPRTKTCPASSPCTTRWAAACPKGTPRTGARAFCPASTRGPPSSRQGAPIDNLFRAEGVTDREQRAQLDLLKRLNQRHLEHSPDDSELAARIESFELAYRMQMAAPECLDLEKESRATQSLYGLDNPKCTHFAKQCLMARRLVERGVRFVQIYSGGMENERSWDGHQNIVEEPRRLRRRDRYADRRPA